MLGPRLSATSSCSAKIGCWTSAAVLACLSLACGNAAEEQAGHPAIELASDGPVIEQGTLSEGAGATTTDLPGHVKLAEVKFSDVHFVEFWQEPSGSVTVVEQYNVDLTGGSKLGNFRAGRDSYAELYQRLSGDHADGAALERLHAADAARRSTGGSAPTENTSINPALIKTDPPDTPDRSGGMVTKSLPTDSLWFQNTHCIPRERAADGEDRVNCFRDTLPDNPGGWLVTWVVEDFEQSNIALFNAASSGTASIHIDARDCFFQDFCNEWYFARRVTVQPRFVAEIRTNSDDGFRTRAGGTSLALHYMFWE
jgi:hypothetical protein